MSWVEENDLDQKVLDRFSSVYSYVFKDEEISMTNDEEEFVFFIWSIALRVMSKFLNNEPESIVADLEKEENALWAALEEDVNNSKSTTDLLFEHCDEEELFALVEDGVAYDNSDPQFPLASKELADLLLVKMIATVNVLCRVIAEK